MATPSTHIKPDPEMTYIKSENGAPVPGLKYEHPHDDDELYEDAGDLDVSSGGRDVWLVKLPAFLAERWRDIDDDEEITLGVVKIPPADQDMTKLKLSLERNETNGLETPLEYELQITNMEVSNTYVFTEKDMPGFETSSTSTGKPGDPPIPARLLYQNRKPDSSSSTGAPAKPDWKNKNAAGGANGQRYSPYVRKTIPKKTAIVGTARHEITMIPVYNEEYRKFQHKKQLLEEAPKYSTKFLDTQLKPNLLGAGTAGGMAGGKKFESFIKTDKPTRKPTDAKAYRMSQRDLISNLFACFKEFEFWSIKSLRAKLNQPDVWLREGLSEVATLVTHGTNSGKWTLKPDYKPMVQGDLDQMEAALEKAATGGGVGSGTGEMPIEIDDDDEEEEEVEMEDVI